MAGHIEADLVPSPSSKSASAPSLASAHTTSALASTLVEGFHDRDVPSRLGLWVDVGYHVYYAKFVSLVLLAAIGVGLGVVTLGFALPIVASIMAVVVLRELTQPDSDYRLRITPGICIHGLMVMLTQNLLAYGGTYALQNVPYVSGFATAIWAVAIETLFAFALLFVVGHRLPAWIAVGQSFGLASKAGLSLLWLYVMGAAASQCGGVLLGVGAILTAPILPCLLAAAFVSLTTDLSIRPAREGVAG